jgi:hypothetical protein
MIIEEIIFLNGAYSWKKNGLFVLGKMNDLANCDVKRTC